MSFWEGSQFSLLSYIPYDFPKPWFQRIRWGVETWLRKIDRSITLASSPGASGAPFLCWVTSFFLPGPQHTLPQVPQAQGKVLHPFPTPPLWARFWSTPECLSLSLSISLLLPPLSFSKLCHLKLIATMSHLKISQICLRTYPCIPHTPVDKY